MRRRLAASHRNGWTFPTPNRLPYVLEERGKTRGLYPDSHGPTLLSNKASVPGLGLRCITEEPSAVCPIKGR